MTELAGKVALVTGASRGIGHGIALSLGRAGATVAGTATSESGALAITQAFEKAGIRGAGFVLNVTDPVQTDTVVAAVQQQLGDISILVNNAGVTRDNLLMRMKDEEWQDILTTNLTSVYRLSKLMMRSMMKARAGRIINITSVVASLGNAGQSNYAAAKAGVEGFTRALAREVGSRNITVNCIAPGFIDTDMTRSLDDTQRQALTAQIPLGRLGSVDDVAAAAAFLASGAASYITGCTLHVNGGMYMG